MSDFYQNSSEKILAGLEKVKLELNKQKIPIEISVNLNITLIMSLNRKSEKKNF